MTKPINANRSPAAGSLPYTESRSSASATAGRTCCMQQLCAAACSVQSAALSAYTAALTEQLPWAHIH